MFSRRTFSKRTDWQLAPNRFTEAQREVAASGRDVLDLTVSNPVRAGFHYDTESILRSLANPKAMDYDPQPKGLLAAREAVVQYYREQHPGPSIDPEAVVLTTSTSEGYSYTFRLLCNPDDEILVPKPSYPLFEFLADLQDVKLISYPLLYDHGWQIDFHSLEKSVTPKTRAVVVVHPNNPTGSHVSAGERTALNAFCRDRGLALIADEVFLDYPIDDCPINGKPRATFTGNPEALTFVLSGISKISGLPQMKLAWLVASGPEGEVSEALARLEVIADTYLSMNAPIQWATSVLLAQRKVIQPSLLERLRINLKELDRQLQVQETCERLIVEGGWNVVLRVPANQPDEDLAIALLKNASVLVHPGHFYDFATDGYLVLSLLTSPPDFREGLTRILKLASEL